MEPAQPNSIGRGGVRNKPSPGGADAKMGPPNPARWIRAHPVGASPPLGTHSGGQCLERQQYSTPVCLGTGTCWAEQSSRVQCRADQGPRAPPSVSVTWFRRGVIGTCPFLTWRPRPLRTPAQSRWDRDHPLPPEADVSAVRALTQEAGRPPARPPSLPLAGAQHSGGVHDGVPDQLCLLPLAKLLSRSEPWLLV